jgi:hypothetical protein
VADPRGQDDQGARVVERHPGRLVDEFMVDARPQGARGVGETGLQCQGLCHLVVNPRVAELGGERGILRQHGALEPLQVRARLDAELLHQHPAGRLVGRQRIGLPPAAVEGDHQLLMQPFPQRVRGGQRLKLADHLGMTAERQIGVDPVLEDTDVQLLQPRDLRLRERFIAQVGEWRAAPEREGLAELVRRLPQLVRRQSLSSQPGQALEPVDIEFVRPNLQAVRAWAGR